MDEELRDRLAAAIAQAAMKFDHPDELGLPDVEAGRRVSADDVPGLLRRATHSFNADDRYHLLGLVPKELVTAEHIGELLSIATRDHSLDVRDLAFALVPTELMTEEHVAFLEERMLDPQTAQAAVHAAYDILERTLELGLS